MAGALFEYFPALQSRLPRVQLGAWPSPLDRATVGGRVFLAKREDLSAEGYAGNKIRPLELVFGQALARGLPEVWATGAYGSNHALATVVHARRVGLSGRGLLWPQPPSQTARENLRATVACADQLVWARSVLELPMRALWIAERRRALVMVPGAATPLFALGHAQGALELAQQLHEARQPEPALIVTPVGSTCTIVGILVGTALAVHLGLLKTLPHVLGLRVTPWPITSALRIARMVEQAARVLGERGGPRVSLPLCQTLGRLEVSGAELGPGYGVPTRAGWEAMAAFMDGATALTRICGEGEPAPMRLDTTYSAKGAAGLLKRLPRAEGPVIFWMTKSHAPLPAADPAREASLPRGVYGWLKGLNGQRLRDGARGPSAG